MFPLFSLRFSRLRFGRVWLGSMKGEHFKPNNAIGINPIGK
jgi:hypothetical protein